MTLRPCKTVTTARAPGKIILSGEHAVVYGAPALAMAVDRFVTTTVTRVPTKEATVEFGHGSSSSVASFPELRQLQIKIEQAYQDFLVGKRAIQEVIHAPLELVQYAFIYLWEKLLLLPPEGIQLRVTENLPIGCGMGASAAVILSLMHALVTCYDVALTGDEYLYFGKMIERLQHGNSSGLDLFLSLHGGTHYFTAGEVNRRLFPSFPFMLVNTGVSQSSTGECVAASAPHFRDSAITQQFAQVTAALDRAFQQGDLVAGRYWLEENHKLLKYLGVVPAKVAAFIDEVTARGSAAKISGAGAIAGDNGGIVLVVGSADIWDLLAAYHYEVVTVQGEGDGLQII